MLEPGNAEADMSKPDFPAVERMVANTINETRRRDWRFQTSEHGGNGATEPSASREKGQPCGP
jgi:hypothetical protein